jgi:hypothetical protein
MVRVSVSLLSSPTPNQLKHFGADVKGTGGRCIPIVGLEHRSQRTCCSRSSFGSRATTWGIR